MPRGKAEVGNMVCIGVGRKMCFRGQGLLSRNILPRHSNPSDKSGQAKFLGDLQNNGRLSKKNEISGERTTEVFQQGGE